MGLKSVGLILDDPPIVSLRCGFCGAEPDYVRNVVRSDASCDAQNEPECLYARLKYEKADA